MSIFLDNFNWISVNVGLALLGVLFCILFLRTKNNFLRLPFFILWVLFVPNTIYLITDIQHLPEQFLKSNLIFKFLLVIQYLVVIFLGVITYIASVYPIEVFFSKDKKDKQISVFFIFLFNFLIAFAVALGKTLRTNSWDIVTNPMQVAADFYTVAISPGTMFFVVVFGFILNLLYFYVIRSFKKDLSRIKLTSF